MISCSEPSTYQVVTWKVTSGHGLADQTTQDCFQGSFNTGGTPTTVTLSGCGSHKVTIVPQATGSAVGDTVEHDLVPPMRFTIHVC
jgi:hypothetical protein